MATSTTARGGRSRIFLVDDHPIVRRGLAELINNEPDLRVCGEAADAESAVSAIAASGADLVIADITLPKADGIELIRFLKRAKVEVPVVVLTMHEEEFFAERALRAGAKGFVMKYRPMRELLDAIRSALAGRLYVSAEATEQLLNNSLGLPRRKGKGIEALSDRERQVLELLGRGEGTRAVADQLRLSVKTIETYRAKIKEKLQLRSAAQLVQRAVQWVERARPGPMRKRMRSPSAT